MTNLSSSPQPVHKAKYFKQHLFRRYKDYILFVAALVGGVVLVGLLGKVFFELLDSLRNKQLGEFDDNITLYVRSFKSSFTEWFYPTITHLGDRFAYLILVVILFVYLYIRKGNFVFSLQAILVLSIAGALSFWLKDLIGRPRPEAVHELGIRTYSFPSGHSMSSIAFYGFLVYLTWRIYESKVKKIVISAILVLLIISIGLSRIYLQVHYPSDVLAGFAAGAACLLIFIMIFAALRFWHRKKGEDTQPDTAKSA